MIRRAALACVVAATPLAAQDVTVTPLPPADLPTLMPAPEPELSADDIDNLIRSLESEGAQTEQAVPQPEVTAGTGAVLRGLDKLNATVEDLTVPSGSAMKIGRIEIAVQECRYPSDDPQANAYAFLTIRETGAQDLAFRGWMIADSPALNPLDHPRYDVWVLRCTTS
jgi:hypothetical protein